MKVPERKTISDKDFSVLLSEFIALKKGDVSAHLPIECSGLSGKLSEAFNDVIELNEPRAQLARLRQAAGTQGRFKRRASLGEVPGFRKAVDRQQLSSDLRGWQQR